MTRAMLALWASRMRWWYQRGEGLVAASPGQPVRGMAGRLGAPSGGGDRLKAAEPGGGLAEHVGEQVDKLLPVAGYGRGAGAQPVEGQVQVGAHGGVDTQLGGDAAKPGWPALLVVVGGVVGEAVGQAVDEKGHFGEQDGQGDVVGPDVPVTPLSRPCSMLALTCAMFR